MNGNWCCRRWCRPRHNKVGPSCWWRRPVSLLARPCNRRACAQSGCVWCAPTPPWPPCGRPSRRCAARACWPSWPGCPRRSLQHCGDCNWRRPSSSNCCGCFVRWPPRCRRSKCRMRRPPSCGCKCRGWPCQGMPPLPLACRCRSSSAGGLRWRRHSTCRAAIRSWRRCWWRRLSGAVRRKRPPGLCWQGASLRPSV